MLTASGRVRKGNKKEGSGDETPGASYSDRRIFNMQDILGIAAIGIISSFGLGFLLTVAGPTWTHGIAAWMMLPGLLALGLGLGVLGAKAISR